jgi:hypothetical protein
MTTPATTFTPKGVGQLANTLPELRTAELKLRAIAAAAGITYSISDFGGLRTPADTAKLIGYRDEEVRQARAAAEAKARKEGKTAAQIKAASDTAANAAYYRVSSFDTGYHGVGGAFDIAIETTPKGMGKTEALTYLGARAGECGLKWGGTFKDNPSTAIVEKPDPWHFELAQPRAAVETKWKTYAATNVVKNNVGKGGAVLPIILFGIVVAGAIALAFTSRDS